MKKSLRNTLQDVSTEFQGQGLSKETIRQINCLTEDADKIGQGEIPQSIEMMSSMLSELLVKRHDMLQEHVHFYIQTFTDESFDIVYHPGYEDIKEGEPGQTENTQGDAYDDPDYYNRVSAMLNDIVDAADDGQVVIVPDTLSLSAKSKMALYDAIARHMDEEGLDTPEMITTGTPDKDLGDPRQVMMEMMYLNAAIARRQNPDNQLAMFVAAEARPFMSREFYEASLLKAANADLSISMDHILKTIRQEDGISAPDTPEERMRFGGMN